eukprot:3366248-Pleurochrysis_carterae.AAC.1
MAVLIWGLRRCRATRPQVLYEVESLVRSSCAQLTHRTPIGGMGVYSVSFKMYSKDTLAIRPERVIKNVSMR